ncbi:MAG: peptide chain release factor N(5)-glutamine methyltransferase [Clostridiaceae bacterium]|nr:peptide chain release factor N(5)-glutamine methyltransferase [Clostridiaceae bacterium]
MVTTYRDLYDTAFEALSGLPMPDLETREIVSLAGRLCGDQIDAHSIQSRYREAAPEDAARQLTLLLERRLCGEPLAYLLGEWDFCGLNLIVTKDVLVPRADTETVALRAVKLIREHGFTRVLDLCCGSGCIGAAILQHTKADVTFVDLSEPALDVTRANLDMLGFSGRAEVVCADALDEPPADIGPFELIVSNPPYISADEMSVLDVEVAAFEPTDALYGGSDGLNFYRAICAYWKSLLLPGGRIVFEIGMDQAADVTAILERNGFREIETGQDLSGRDRVVTAVLP